MSNLTTIESKIQELEGQLDRYNKMLERTAAYPLECLATQTTKLINEVNQKTANHTFTGKDLQNFIVDLGRLSSLAVEDLDNAHSYIVEIEKIKSQIVVLKTLI